MSICLPAALRVLAEDIRASGNGETGGLRPRYSVGMGEVERPLSVAAGRADGF